MLPPRRTGAAMRFVLTAAALLIALTLILRPIVTDYSMLNPIGLLTWIGGAALMLFLLLQALKTPSTPK